MDHTTGTSTREVSPAETLQRLLQPWGDLPEERGLVGVLDPTLRFFESDGAFAVIASWKADIDAAWGRSRYRLRLRRRCSGKGLSAVAAQVSALMEVVERLSSIPEGELTQAYRLLGPPRHAPRSVLVDSGQSCLDLKGLTLPCPYHDEPLFWVSAEEAQTHRGVLVPAQIVFTSFVPDEVLLRDTFSTNGLASGNSMAEARLHALLELVERHSLALHACERGGSISPPAGSLAASILSCLHARGIPVCLEDITSIPGIPAYRASFRWEGGVMAGSGAHLDGETALHRALCELEAALIANPDRRVGPGVLPKEEPLTGALPALSTGVVEADLEIMERTLINRELTPLYVDLTRRTLGIPVVRAIVPGLSEPDHPGS